MLELRNLAKSFGGVQAVLDLTLTLSAGRITGLIGPNGAGKTTVFNLITGVFRPSGGSIRFEGRELVGVRPYAIVRQGIARTFQTPRLFRGMTVWEHVLVAQNHRAGRGPGLFLRGRGGRALLEGAREALDLVGLWEARARRAPSLSYGDQRRLEIARALATGPRLLLLDEPAAGMNATECEELVALIGKIRQRGVTVLLVEHHMQVVMGACDRILVLNFGRPIAEGPPAAIREDPQVVAAYLGMELADAGA